MFPSKYPSSTVTPKLRDKSNNFVSTPLSISVIITSISKVSDNVATLADAVTTAFVPVLSKVRGSLTWYPLPTLVTVTVETWSPDVLLTFAAAPYPTPEASVIVTNSSTIYPSPPSTIVMSESIPVSIAESATPAAVVAVIVSPIWNVPTNVVTTNSIKLIVPILRVVTSDTNAVAREVPPVIVNPLKSRYVAS